MRADPQTLDLILQNLSPLSVEWMDETASSVIATLSVFPIKPAYTRADVRALLASNFNEGILCCRLFLGLSKDQMEAQLREAFGGAAGSTRFAADPDGYAAKLEGMGLLDAMAVTINHKPVWSDILVERLRSGRGSAISGQRRGRGLEDFAEALVTEVFGDAYEVRCTFVGAGGREAKCDIAIPSKADPRIIIESKAYGATGSKMTDIIGDIDAIVDAKRHDSALLFVTDGITWKARASDMGKLVARQNQGQITRIYTSQMRDEFLEDLRTLKAEHRL